MPGILVVEACLKGTGMRWKRAKTVERLLPLTISARQVGQVIQPMGDALLKREDRLGQRIREQGAHTHLSRAHQ